MKHSLDAIIRQTRRYWYVDGLAEITVGLIFIVLSGYFFAQARIKTISVNPVLANLVLLAVFLLVAWLFRGALQAVKARITYPRTGYVAFPAHHGQPLWQRYGLLIWLILVSVSLIALASRSHSFPAWEPLLMGAIGGITMLAVSYRFGLLRLAVLACALVLVGGVVAYVNPGESLALLLSSLMDGVCFIISGGITLVRYLLNNPRATEADL